MPWIQPLSTSLIPRRVSKPTLRWFYLNDIKFTAGLFSFGGNGMVAQYELVSVSFSQRDGSYLHDWMNFPLENSSNHEDRNHHVVCVSFPHKNWSNFFYFSQRKSCALLVKHDTRSVDDWLRPYRTRYVLIIVPIMDCASIIVASAILAGAEKTAPLPNPRECAMDTVSCTNPSFTPMDILNGISGTFHMNFTSSLTLSLGTLYCYFLIMVS